MKRRRRSLAVVLTLALVPCALWIWQQPEAEKPGPAEFPAGQPQIATSTTSGHSGPSRFSPALAARLSPRAWTPPAEFSRPAVPAARWQVHRGRHAQRHYESPVSCEVDALQAPGPPGVLAATPADGRLHLEPEEIDLHTLLARRMVFDATALERVIAGQASQVIAPTTGDEVLTLDIASFKTRSAQSHTLFGRVVGEENTSDVQLVYHDGVIHGTVARYALNQHLEYRILPDGHMMVRELDQSSMTDTCGNGAHTEAGGTHRCDEGCSHEADAEQLLEEATGQDVNIAPSQEPGEPMGDTPGWTTVDVVVGYGQEARTADGGYSQIEARVLSAVDRMNTAFANSLILNTEMNLLGTIEDPDYAFGGTDIDSMSSELGDLNNASDGDLDTVSDYATQLGADFVSFVIRESDGSAGLAYRPGRASVVARTYITTSRMTFAHELGHNLGCDHSWGDSRQDYKSAYGWRMDFDGSSSTTDDRVRTIMAYDWNWGSGQRVSHYANPNVSYNTAPTGADYGHDVRTDTKGDQRYFQGGFDALEYPDDTNLDPTKYGFDGNTAALAAYNADTIASGTGGSTYGAAYASTRKTRVSNAVLSPISSDNWAVGSTQSVFFVGGDHTDAATLDLYKGGVYQWTIASGVNPATERNYAWSVLGGPVSGPDYQIRVTLNHAEGGSSSFDSSNFTITNSTPSNTVQLVGPDGGETFTTWQNCEITWFSKLTGNVKIELLKGGAIHSVIAGSEVNDGRYHWVIPDSLTSGADYRIRVSSVNNSSYMDSSAANFSILQDALAIAVDTTGFSWVTSGNADWFNQSTTTHDGVDAAESGNIGDNQTTSMETTFTEEGTLTFWWKVSSESGWDWLELYVNDALQTGSNERISGTVDWVQRTVAIPAGTTTVRWTYSKDGSASRNSDTAWVDQVIFTPNVPTYTVNYNGNGNTGGGAPSDQTKYQGTPLSLAGNTGNLVNSGFTFEGWNTQANGNGTDYAVGATYNTDANLTLYAKWTSAPTYTVSYNGNGNTDGSVPSNQTKTQGVNLVLAGNTGGLIKTDFGFSGWNTQANGNGTSYAVGASFTTDANTTLYAEWNGSPVPNAGDDQTVNLSDSAPWTPAEITTQLWLDADDAATITLNGSTVSQWNDKSGNSRHATQGTAAAQPTRTVAGLNGKNVLTFDATDDLFAVDLDFLAGTSHSAFIVTKASTYSNIYGAANDSAGSGSLHIGFRNNSSFRMNYWGNDWYGSFGASFNPGQANLLNYVWLPGSPKEIYVNATSAGTSQGSGPDAGTITAMAGGGRIGRTTNHAFYGGDIAEIIMVTGGISLQERERVEGYLAYKWGLDGDLPLGHTYENLPPGGTGLAAVADLSSASVTDPEDDATTVTWSVVGTPPANVVFADANAADTTATFTAEGAYTLLLTASDGTSSSEDTVVITVGPASTPYELWTAGTFAKAFTDTNSGSDQDEDQFDNVLEFALGTDPTTPFGTPMAYTAGGDITAYGLPITEDGDGNPSTLDYQAVFSRRKDHVVAGLTYRVEFSADLGSWTTSSAGLQIETGVGSTGDYEAVSVPFPPSVPLQAGGTAAPRFFRVEVTMD